MWTNWSLGDVSINLKEKLIFCISVGDWLSWYMYAFLWDHFILTHYLKMCFIIFISVSYLMNIFCMLWFSLVVPNFYDLIWFGHFLLFGNIELLLPCILFPLGNAIFYQFIIFTMLWNVDLCQIVHLSLTHCRIY